MLFSKLEKFIYEKVTQTRLPSTAAALVRNGEVIWTKAFGFRDLKNGLAATPETLYGIGSVTKSFTALAILQLAEQGKLKVSDPVEDYIKFPIQPFGEQVQIGHFLSHTSGLPALAVSESIIGHMTGAGDHWLPMAAYADLHAFMQGAEKWVTHRPGERWFYLNEGYILLGEIIEKCSGLSYWDYVQQHILQPLDMLRTFFLKQEVDKDTNAAVPYLLADDGRHLSSTYPYSHINAKGGIISNVLDLSKYVSMYLAQGKSKSGQIISPESLREMQKERIPTPSKDGPFGDPSYAYGLRITPNFLGRKLVGHGGSVGVATAFIGFLPDENLGVAVLSNGSGFSMEQFGQYALCMALGENPDELPFVRNEQELNQLSGVYETFKGTMKVEVRKAGDLLILTLKDRYHTQNVPLYPEREEENLKVFSTLSAGSKLEVEFILKGREVHLLYERYGLKKTGEL